MPDETLDRPEVLRALFHPRPEYALAGAVSGVQLVSVEVEPGISTGGRLYVAGADAPAILYWHGNGEIAADYDDIAPLYVGMGITLFVVDYRGYGSSEGSPTCHNLVLDARAAFDASGGIFEEYRLAPSRLYVMGRSLGSAAAMEVAARGDDRLSGLIIESGFADTLALLARLAVRVEGITQYSDCFDNADKISRVAVPTLIIHGQNDVLIPAANGEELFRCSGALDKRLLILPGAGHNDLMLVGGEEYFQAIRAFVFGA